MLIQSLVLIATMLIVGGALLTSTLVSAKAALHQAVIHKSETAMSDATAQFVTWAEDYVSKYGTEAPWPSGMQPQSGPIVEDMCSGKIASGGGLSQAGPSSSTGSSSAPGSSSVSGSSSAPIGASPGGACPLTATMQWTVTGSSATSASRAAAQTAAISTAQNLSVSLDEQRVSATLTIIITDASGRTTFANHSRELTARIFDAMPYVAVTGSHDVSTEVGDIHASEGDTGGVGRFQSSNRSTVPTANDPSAFTDTQILTTVDCANSPTNNDQNNPQADGTRVYFDRSGRNYGNLAWAFEAPCAPTYSIDSTNAPSDYPAPEWSHIWYRCSG